MSSRRFILVAVAFSAAALGCSKPQPTPAGLDAEFRALLETLDEERPGASVARLTEFLNQHREYDIVIEIEAEIGRLRFGAEGPLPRGLGSWVCGLRGGHDVC